MRALFAVVAALAVGIPTGIALWRGLPTRSLDALLDPRQALAPLAGALGFRIAGVGALGAIEDHQVAIALDARPDARGRMQPYTVVRVQTGIEDLELAPETRTGGAGGDVTSGDPPFDRHVWADGPSARVSALLDAPTRALLLDLIGEASHREGRWEWWHPGSLTSAALARDRIGAMVAVVRRWHALDTPKALLEVAVTDPVAGVRERAAERLVAWWEQNPADLTPDDAALLASTALFRGPAVRLARLRGAAGRDVLRAHAGEQGELGIEATVALAQLGEPDAEALLLAHLTSRDTRVLAELGEVGGERALAALEALRGELSAWGGAPEPFLRALERIRARLPRPAPE